MRILIIEDEFNLADAISSMLKTSKYSVEIKTDGEEGLDEALTDVYDLIILDVMLPHKNGFDILKELRKEKINSNFHSESRIIRYDFFDKVIKKYKANYLMTAHHGDDLIDTILMRIQRGSNLKGYSGFEILTKKDGYDIVKPLFFYTKKEIQEYMDNNHIKYYIDNTNLEDDYLRNRYRNHIIPKLHQEYANIHEKYFKYSKCILEADEFINKYVEKVLPDIYKDNKLDIKKFKQEENIIQHRILEYILSTLYIKDLYLVSDSNIDEIFKAINSNNPSITIKLPNNHFLEKEYNYLYVDKDKVINSKISDDIYNYEDSNYIIKKVEGSSDNSNYTIRLNTKELVMPLRFDYRKSGDKMKIKNSSGYRKLKDIFIDLKIPVNKRDFIPILYDNNNEVIWIPGMKKSNYDKKSEDNHDLILYCMKK